MDSSWDVVRHAADLVEQGEDFALATVVWREPPTSGKPGARAVVTRDGVLHGWIGGSCTEPIVLKEAKAVLDSGEARLVLIGKPGQFGDAIEHLDGAVFRTMTCTSEGAVQVYVEPVLPSPHLVVVGHSPMAQTLVDLARVLGWRSELVAAEAFTAEAMTPASFVVLATQGHRDEESLETAASSAPAYVGLVASAKKGAGLIDFVAGRGAVPAEKLARVHVPAGLDLGHTTHREIAVAVLADLVQRRAAGELVPVSAPAMDGEIRERRTLPLLTQPEAIDPVCHMTVAATDASYPFEHEGTTYWFCCLPCNTKFSADPAAYLTEA